MSAEHNATDQTTSGPQDDGPHLVESDRAARAKARAIRRITAFESSMNIIGASFFTWMLAAALLGASALARVTSSADEPAPGSHLDGSMTATMIMLNIVCVGALVLSKWAWSGDGFGAHWDQTRTPVARFVRATILTVTIMWTIGILNPTPLRIHLLRPIPEHVLRPTRSLRT